MAERISDLRVVDLRAALEKRNLDKSGNKASLVERIEQALKDERTEESVFLTEMNDAAKKSGRRSTRGADGDGDEQDEEDADDNEKPGVNGGINQVDDSTMESNGSAPKDGTAADDIPNPSDVEPKCPFTVEDTIKMHQQAAAVRKSTDDNGSLVVNTDAASESSLTLDSQPPGTAPGSVCNGAASGDKNAPVAESTANSTEEDTGVPSIAGNSKKEAAATEENPDSTTASSTTSTLAVASANSTKNTAEEGSERSDSAGGNAAQANATKPTSSGKALWINGLASNTRATDLKTLFSRYGRVMAAKIVTSAKAPGSKCFGFVSMSTTEEATVCIQNLHRTDLNGQKISVERSKNDNVLPFKRSTASTDKKSLTAKPAATPSTTTAAATASSGAASTTDKQPADTTEGEVDKKSSSSRDKKDDKKEGSVRRKEGDRSKDGKRSSRERSKRRSRERNGDARDSRRPLQPRQPYIRRGMAGGPMRGGFNHYRGNMQAGGYYNRYGTGTQGQGAGGYLRNSRPGYNHLNARGGARFGMGMGYRGAPRGAMMGGRMQPHMMERSAEEVSRERERILATKLRQQEIEHAQREEQLKLERERERLRFENERLRREKLELQQMRAPPSGYSSGASRYPGASSGSASGPAKRPYVGGGGSFAGPEPKRMAYGSYDSRQPRGRDSSPPPLRRDYHSSSTTGGHILRSGAAPQRDHRPSYGSGLVSGDSRRGPSDLGGPSGGRGLSSYRPPSPRSPPPPSSRREIGGGGYGSSTGYGGSSGGISGMSRRPRSPVGAGGRDYMSSSSRPSGRRPPSPTGRPLGGGTVGVYASSRTGGPPTGGRNIWDDRRSGAGFNRIGGGFASRDSGLGSGAYGSGSSGRSV